MATFSILVASFESNHENHFVCLYCGYFSRDHHTRGNQKGNQEIRQF